MSNEETLKQKTYKKIILMAERHAMALPNALVFDMRVISPEACKNAAEKEVWQKIISGLHHLKSGAPDGSPGLFISAVAKISLRASSLASSLGITPPAFEQVLHVVGYTNEFEEAKFYATRLLETGMADVTKSKKIIQETLVHEDIATRFGIAFMPDEDILLFKKQMVMTLDFMAEAYPPIAKQLMSDIHSLKPDTALVSKGKPRNFDL